MTTKQLVISNPLRDMSTALGDELLRIVQSYEQGITDDQIQAYFKERYVTLPPVINVLLQQNKLKLFTLNGALVYKAVNEQIASKFAGLGPEQILVYQVCERAGDKGIWTRDIKQTTNISQQILTKILKQLEQRLLLKTVRSVTSKSKKLYMVYDLVPAKELTGGPWYTDQEFDSEFVEALNSFVMQVVARAPSGMANVGMVQDKLRASGITRVELSLDELELVLQTLVFDGRLEEVSPAVLRFLNVPSLASASASSSGASSSGSGSGSSSGQLQQGSQHSTMYKVARRITPLNYLTDAPCGMCPVAAQCQDDGVISPQTCVYLAQWLAMPADGEDEKGPSAVGMGEEDAWLTGGGSGMGSCLGAGAVMDIEELCGVGGR